MKKIHSAINKVNCFILLCSLFLLTGLNLNAQLTRNVLFLGNSYTATNNLPQIIKDAALSAGDTLTFDSHTPGGLQLIDHSTNTTSQSKIMAGAWDYIVLQGQSQEPLNDGLFFNNGANALMNSIVQHDPCAEPLFYMTWGRKNGDASNCVNFPTMCTYESMDTNLRIAYMRQASLQKAEVSPVSVVWKYLRQNHPTIELYQVDGSHPSVAGSYAAACSFYTSIFKKDPTAITFNHNLSATDAAIIRNAAKIEVFDSLSLWDFKELPEPKFNYISGLGSANEIIFQNRTRHLPKTTYFWDFGDGSTSPLFNPPAHSYPLNGTYTVTLTSTYCDLDGVHTSFADTTISFCNHTPTIFAARPWLCIENDTLWTEPADSYQWFSSAGDSLPETNQYLPDYYQYSVSGSRLFVQTSDSGCAELSKEYIFDLGSATTYLTTIPSHLISYCIGTIFIVLDFDAASSNLDNIQWYKDGIPILLATNDTLITTAAGVYHYTTIDPNCPFDTLFNTSIDLNVNACAVGIEENNQDLFWSIAPNPVTDFLTIEFKNGIKKEEIQIYNITGHLIKTVEVSETTRISLTDLPSGLYFIRLKNDKRSSLKFIKR